MKKIILATIVLLLCCDVSLLFAQEQSPAQDKQRLEQLKRLQQLSERQQAQQQQQQQQRLLLQQAQQQAQASVAAGKQPGQAFSADGQGQAVPANKTNAPVSQQMVSSQDDLINEAAFRAMTQSQMPLTPQQIMRLRQMFNSRQFASATSPTTPPKPSATSQFVSLAPGSTPPVIRLSQGFVSSLVFLDSTGAPWPIEAYDLGNPTAFNIVWDKKSNTLMVQASSLYTYGNLAVKLKDLSTPVMLTLIPGQKSVDYRVDLRIQGYGPMAHPSPGGQGLPGTENPVLLSILDGVPPPGAQLLKVPGGGAQVWEKEGKFFVRTRFTILSPGWISTMSSADGMKAYEMPKTPILLVSEHGRVMQIKIQGL